MVEGTHDSQAFGSEYLGAEVPVFVRGPSPHLIKSLFSGSLSLARRAAGDSAGHRLRATLAGAHHHLPGGYSAMKWPAVAISMASSWFVIAMAPGAVAAPIPVEAFAARDAISDAALSPDGRYLAMASTIQDRRAVTVRDLKAAPSEARIVLADIPGKFDIGWCRWATSARLLCSYRGIQGLIGNEVQYAATRLVAVDPDGKNQLVLVQNSDEAGGRSAQYEDRIIGWHPGKADTVLIEADESLLDSREQNINKGAGGSIYLKRGFGRPARTSTRGYPAIFELNVVTGNLEVLQRSYPPIRHFLTDFHGVPRVASGFESGSKTIEYFVRAPTDTGWHHLLKYEAFAKGELRTPIAIDVTESHAGLRDRRFGGTQCAVVHRPE